MVWKNLQASEKVPFNLIGFAPEEKSKMMNPAAAVAAAAAARHAVSIYTALADHSSSCKNQRYV